MLPYHYYYKRDLEPYRNEIGVAGTLLTRAAYAEWPRSRWPVGEPRE